MNLTITLQKVHHMPSLSEETECFDAVVCLNGTPAFFASNRGHGGQTDLSPLPKQPREDFQALLAQLEAYAASLPQESLGEHEGRALMHQPDAEDLVDRALTDWLHAKDVKRLMSSKVVLVEGSKVYTLKLNKGQKPRDLVGPQRESLLAELARRHPGCTVLNYLPEADAIAAYIAAGRAA